MAHYAKVNNGVVEKVIVAEEEFLKTFVDHSPGEWVQTSYNTFGNEHQLGGEPLRKNFAGIGYHYDGIGFYAPKPFDSWTLNKTTYLWEAPVAMPEDDKEYTWNEADQTWDEINYLNE